MVVANPVVNDSRVLKTAQTVRKLGYSLRLFGIGPTEETVHVEGHPFEIVLLPNPRFEMLRRGAPWGARGEDRDYDTYCRLAADSLRKHLTEQPPAILHTHDMLGLAIGANLRQSAQARSCPWIHDLHEYVIGLTELAAPVREFFAGVEKAHIRHPEALTCVSPALAALLKDEYSLSREPTLVLNAPRRSDFDPFCAREIRAELGVAAAVPLVVYSGGVKPIRGVDTAVEALPLLPDVHVAIVTNSSGKYLEHLRQRAAQLGVSGRVHYHPYVAFQEVTSFLRSASVGVHPIHRYPNAEIALPNKLFEYLHAGLPVVTSNNRCMEDFVREHKCGESFEARDAQALAAALRKVLNTLRDRPTWRNEIRELSRNYCWEDQEKRIAEIYEALEVPKTAGTSAIGGMAPQPRCIRIAQLPVGAAGQPRALADAFVEQGMHARAYVVGDKYHYGADVTIERAHLRMPRAASLIADLTEGFDVFHFHSRPLLLEPNAAYPTGWDLFLLRAAGKKVYYHFRGSDVRLASVFEKSCRYNYVAEDPAGVCSKYNEREQRAFMQFAQGVCHGTFVTDPELQIYAPWAQVVPRVVDLKKWPCLGVRKEGSLRVVHAPTRRGTKGSEYVLAAVEQLRAEGVGIEFKLVEGMTNDEARAVYTWADVVVDQLRIGWYGVLAVEAMALGKAVVVYVREDLKHHLPYPFPVAIANPDNVREVLGHLAEHRDEVVELGIRGRRYVEEIHEGHRVARTLLGIYAEPGRELDPALATEFVLKQAQRAHEHLDYQPPGAVHSAFAALRRIARLRNLGIFLRVAKSQGAACAMRKALARIVVRSSSLPAAQARSLTRATAMEPRRIPLRRRGIAFWRAVRREGILRAIRKVAALVLGRRTR